MNRLKLGPEAGGCSLSAVEVRALQEAGYSSLDTIAMEMPKKLLQVKGIGEKKVEMIRAAAKKSVPMSFLTATNFLAMRQRMALITTGCGALDAILKGGIETGGITEIFGEFRTGKSQLCHTLAVSCQLPVEEKGGSGKCLYIDTEGTFRPERLVEIAKRFGLQERETLENVTYARAFNTEHQKELLVEAAALMTESRFALLVVDSMTGLFRTDYSGRGELADRQQALNLSLRSLQRIADFSGCAVVITNQVMASPDGQANPYIGPQVKPVGGHVIAHASQTRLFLKKGRGDQRICKIFDSPHLPEQDATFAITPGGVTDCEEEGGGKGNRQRR